ncbi:MAG: GerMN domain-containing protein [Actinobacteria bacterium]|nr:GerMN domain-containing protein [Actinomycetota bacterium]
MGKRSVLAAILAAIVAMTFSYVAYAQEEQPIPTEEEEASAPSYVFLYKDGELAQVERDITGGNQMVEFAVLELLKGPSEDEVAAGYVTHIPESVKLQYTTVKQDRSEFSVNLSREFMELSGDRDSSLKAMAQIVKTVQEISGIASVGVTVAGEAMGDPPIDAYEALGVTAEEVNAEISGIEPQTEEGSNTGMVLGIVFGALGAILLAILIFYLLKRRKNSGGSAEAKQTSGKKTDSKKAKK